MRTARKPKNPFLAETLRLVPPTGGWCMLTGGPHQSRRSIRPAIEGCIAEYLDVIWCHNEAPTHQLFDGWDYEMPPDDEELPISRKYRIVSDNHRDEGIHNQIPGLSPFGSMEAEFQRSILTAALPVPIRFWNGELMAISQEFLNDLIAGEQLEIIKFDKVCNRPSPLIEEAERDIIDALMLDGLNRDQALVECITAGIIGKEHQSIPNWFYRPKNEIRKQFIG